MSIPNWRHNLFGVARELTYLENEADRKAVWKEIHSKVSKTRQVQLLQVLVFPLFGGLAWYVGFFKLGPWLVQSGFSRGAAAFSGAVLVQFVLLICAFGTFWFHRRKYQKAVRARLLQKGVPVCLPCGYNLAGLTEPRCPECGRAFEPAILDKMEQRS